MTIKSYIYVCIIIFLNVPTWTFKLLTFFHFDERLYSQMFIQFLDYFFRAEYKKYNH